MKTAAKVGKSGRAQIPISIREKLGITEGDQIVIEIEQVIKGSMTQEVSQ